MIERLLMIAAGAVFAGLTLFALLWYLDQAFARRIATIEQQLNEINPKDLP